VGSPLPALKDDLEVRRFVTFATHPDEACRAVETLLRRPQTEEDRRARTEFAARNSWTERAQTVVDIIQRHLVERGRLKAPTCGARRA
jgi:hypothetical protein